MGTYANIHLPASKEGLSTLGEWNSISGGTTQEICLPLLSAVPSSSNYPRFLATPVFYRLHFLLRTRSPHTPQCSLQVQRVVDRLIDRRNVLEHVFSSFMQRSGAQCLLLSLISASLSGMRADRMPSR